MIHLNKSVHEDSVPVSLTVPDSMVLNGPNIESNQVHLQCPQSVLTISQLLMYISLVKRHKDLTSTTRHCMQSKGNTIAYMYIYIYIYIYI